MKKEEILFYKRGAEHFGYDFNQLKNKEEYKEEYYLNTGLWWFRNKKKIIIVTSCIASYNYIYDLIKEPMIGFDIYYNDCNIDLERFNKTLHSKVKFIKLNEPLDRFLEKHKTLVLISGGTLIYDEKEFGLIKGKTGKREVYRIKNNLKYDKKINELKEIIKK